LEKTFLNPQELPDWSDSFSQIIVAPRNATKTIYISGQVSVDNQKNLIGEGNLAAQARQAFQNLQTALAAAGATTADVVKVNIYVVNYKPEDAEAVGNAFRQFFPHERLPTGTWLGVQSLAKEGFLIEVDAIAVI
jgi:enamine deaminase RidA (YjgF/YER057c/UK114 family)